MSKEYTKKRFTQSDLDAGLRKRQQEKSFAQLIEESSLGSPVAKAIRQKTNIAELFKRLEKQGMDVKEFVLYYPARKHRIHTAISFPRR